MDMAFEKAKKQHGMELVEVNTSKASKHVAKLNEVFDTKTNAAIVALVHLLSQSSITL